MSYKGTQMRVRKRIPVVFGILLLAVLALSALVAAWLRGVPAPPPENPPAIAEKAPTPPPAESPPAPATPVKTGEEPAEGGTFHVYVLDREAVPLEGAAVSAVLAEAPDGGEHPRFDGVTDAAGSCDLTGLPWGRYAIRGVQGASADVTRATLDEQRTPVSIELVLRPAGVVRGTVTDLADAPVPGARVALVSQIRGRQEPAAIETDSDGAFWFSEVPLGEYRVQASAEGFAPELSRAVGIDEPPLAIRLTRGGSLAMRVLGAASGKPVPDVTVAVRFPDFEELDTSAVSDDRGRIDVTGLPAGRCVVQSGDPGYVLEPLETVLEAAPGQAITGDLFVQEAASVSGRVTDDETGEPVPGVTVIARNMPAKTLYWKSETGPDGAYSIRGLAAERCEVSLGLHPESYVAKSEESRTTVEPVPGEAITGVDFTLHRGSVVEGVVMDELGVPVPGANVRLRVFIQDGGKPRPVSGRRAQSGAEGRFCFPGLDLVVATAYDSWRVGSGNVAEAFPPIEVSLHAGFRGAASENTGRIVLPPEGLQGITLQLGKPGEGTISGHIFNERGGPMLAGLNYQRHDGENNAGSAMARSDVDGFFLFTDLLPGRYTISAAPFSESGLGHTSRPLLEVQLAAGQQVKNLRLTLAEGWSIRGRIVDPAGNPVKSCMIYAFPNPMREDSDDYHSVTDDDGRFILKNLDEGNYTLQFGFGFGKEENTGRPPVTVAAGDEVELVWDAPTQPEEDVPAG